MEDAMAIFEEFGVSGQWFPCVKENQTVAHVFILFEGPNVTKFTVMEGTRIIDRGSGKDFIRKNARFMHSSPEVKMWERPWANPTEAGFSLAATEVVFRIPAPSLDMAAYAM